VFGSFYHNCVIIVAAFVKAYNSNTILIFSNGKLTFGAILFPVGFTLDKLIHFQLLNIFIFFFDQSFDFEILEKLCIVILDNFIDLFDFLLYLLIIW
jgi:hypothetical protein